MESATFQLRAIGRNSHVYHPGQLSTHQAPPFLGDVRFFVGDGGSPELVYFKRCG